MLLLLSHLVLLHHGRHVLPLPHLHLLPVPLLLLSNLSWIMASIHLLLMPVVSCGSCLPLPLPLPSRDTPPVVRHRTLATMIWHRTPLSHWTRSRGTVMRRRGHVIAWWEIGGIATSPFSLLSLVVHSHHLLVVPDKGTKVRSYINTY